MLEATFGAQFVAPLGVTVMLKLLADPWDM